MRREANVFQFSMMLKACHGSDQQRELIYVTMPKAGVKPNVITYTTLVNMLMMEGEREAARVVVEKEMPKAGVVPNNTVTAPFSTSPEGA